MHKSQTVYPQMSVVLCTRGLPVPAECKTGKRVCAGISRSLVSMDIRETLSHETETTPTRSIFKTESRPRHSILKLSRSDKTFHFRDRDVFETFKIANYRKNFTEASHCS